MKNSTTMNIKNIIVLFILPVLFIEKSMAVPAPSVRHKLRNSFHNEKTAKTSDIVTTKRELNFVPPEGDMRASQRRAGGGKSGKTYSLHRSSMTQTHTPTKWWW
jgi:hypothetical protein